MPESSLVADCRRILRDTWNEVRQNSESKDYLADAELRVAIARSINSRTKTYRYVLPAQLVAKLADGTLDCTCVQAKRGGDGAFDARSIAQDVIVPFDQENDRVLGGAPEPYANNPLRIPAVSPEYRDAQKDKSGWDDLCFVLEAVQCAGQKWITRDALLQALVEVLRRLDAVRITYAPPTRISLESAISLIESFVSERSGGDRFEVIAAALFHAAGVRFGLFPHVRRSSVNTADESSGMVTDIECIDASGDIVLVVEAKDRELTLSQVRGKISRIREHRITEAFFVSHADRFRDQEATSEVIRHELASGQNIYTTDLLSLSRVLLALMGEVGRREFLDRVGEQLDLYSDVQHRKAWAGLLKAI